jgi:predicted MFS family arabinose efflux permease
MIVTIFNIYKDAFSGLNRSVWALSAILLVNRIGAMVLPFMTLFITKDLGYSMTEAGWVMTFFGIGSIAGAYVGGELTDKWGAYRVQKLSLLCSGILVLSFTIVSQLWQIMIMIFLYAFVTDLLRPANSVAIADFSKVEDRPRSYSLMRFAANIGFAIGPAMGGIVAGLAGYRYIFVIDAVSCFAALFILITYVGTPKSKSKVVAENSDLGVGSETSIKTSYNSAYKDKRYLLFVALVSLYAILFFQLFSSFPVYWAKSWQWSEERIGLLLGLNGLIVVLVEMPFMRRVEHIKSYYKMMTAGTFMLVLGYMVILPNTPSIPAAVALIILFSFSETLVMPFMTNYALSRPNPSRRGQYIALYTMAYGFALGLAPLGCLSLAESIGFQYTYLVATVLSLGLACAFFFGKYRTDESR